MALTLSVPKVVLVAVDLAAKADIDALSCLAARHGTVLRKDILLRILLTYLPETLQSERYVWFVEEVEKGECSGKDVDIDCSAVDKLTEEEAARKARKLHLLPLLWEDAPLEASEDLTALFLLRRAYKVDEEAGLLDELPSLLAPFLDHSPCIRSLMISAILPLLRRNCEYYPAHPIPQTLSAFQHLPDRAAVSLLLSQTGVKVDEYTTIGRDLRGLVGPWLHNTKRWETRTADNGHPSQSLASISGIDGDRCPGWAQVLEWLTTQASRSWRVAVSAVDQWDGPRDVDLGGHEETWLNDQEQAHLVKTYARAAIASAYLIPEASIEALTGAHTILAKVVQLLDLDPAPPLQSAASMLSPIDGQDIGNLLSTRNATHLRNDLLGESNTLTSPTKSATQLLHGLILSALLLTRAGSPCTIRRAGELALLQDERDQKAEAVKLIHAIGTNGAKTDDKYWIKARNEVLWLRDCGSEEDSLSPEHQVRGIFGQLKIEFLDIEILKALLANGRYTLARTLYEESPGHPLPKKLLQDTIFAAALNAFDNASNPNRTRGGLKKCDEIIKAFPQTVEKSLAATQRIEALLKATHSLSDYRLVLKQGEPFTPVVLRVHTDPISIIGKILEQNPKSYTRIQELVDLGIHMAEAGLTVVRDKSNHSTLTAEQEPREISLAEKRVTAMCIDAALAEDDFETAYSYVVQRLSAISEPAQAAASRRRSQHGLGPSAKPPARILDDYSWKAALQAGKYRRTSRTVRPTHLGTASANPEIRHLEQRIECLATALRIAPPPTLQEIVNAFRRCEEELDAAVKAEQEQEHAWDAVGDSLAPMPGGFGPAAARQQQKPRGAASALDPRNSTAASRHQSEDAPMSLFDLSRASVASAQRNLTALSGLRHGGLAKGEAEVGGDGAGEGGDGHPKRKRDQLREAAMGTLVSGVGWLISAPSAERQ